MGEFGELVNLIADAVFPPLCLSCENILGENEKVLAICGECLGRFEIGNGFFCPICRRRLPEPNVTCHNNARFVLASPLSFENRAVQKIIHLLKYRHITKAATPLAFFTVFYLTTISSMRSAGPEDFVMLPVPLHRSKERRRGFNQALLIAREIQRLAGMLDREKRLPSFTIESDVLARVKKTASQTKQKNRDERRRNVENAFVLTDKAKIERKNIMVVDDVFTSGATMGEIAKLLKANGAVKIIALTAART